MWGMRHGRHRHLRKRPLFLVSLVKGRATPPIIEVNRKGNCVWREKKSWLQLETFTFEISLNVPKEGNLGKFLDLTCLEHWTHHGNLEPKLKQNWGSWRVRAETGCIQETPGETGRQFLPTLHTLQASSKDPSLGQNWLWELSLQWELGLN